MVENKGLERVVRIEKKFDALSVSVGERFNNVDERFDEVRDHFESQSRSKVTTRPVRPSKRRR